MNIVNSVRGKDLERIGGQSKMGKESSEDRRKYACRKPCGRFIIQGEKVYYDKPWQLRKRRYIFLNHLIDLFDIYLHLSNISFMRNSF